MKYFYVITWFGRLRDKVGAHQSKLFPTDEKQKAMEFLDSLYASPRNTYIHMERFYS